MTQHEIQAAFVDGWEVDEIVAAEFVANLPGGAAHAWRARIVRAQ